MAQEGVNIEIDGQALQAPKGAMIIQVADEAGIYIPRFCYHPKLSVAANCRMCLVEVEKAPKPVPACAMPVAEGMKVLTRSKLALDAQRSTMEFLLINHPLDCPICDQGGECELQDLALGYGRDIGRYTERKRVIKDKNIGPLVSTDMTRCIQCTRCVRFGEEIAGIRELGATGRGEFMEITTYVERAMTSELSGNVIDICPVGALNARPSRHRGRSWEMVQHALVSPHDGVGSNLYLHTLRGQVMRVVPRANEAINETWIADRDRFSYEGLSSPDRLTIPMIKVNGQWQAADWEAALTAVAKGLRGINPEALGVLASPSATLEELYLLQKITRGLGSHNIDHRLRQSDVVDQSQAPLFPWLGQSIADLEWLDAVLLIGSNVRKEQPMIAHRLRKAALRNGAQVMAINPYRFDCNFPMSHQLIADPIGLAEGVLGVARAVADQSGAKIPGALRKVLGRIEPDAAMQAVAQALATADQGVILMGPGVIHHPAFSLIRACSAFIAEHTEAALGYLTEGANAAGAWLSGAIPHRLAGGEAVTKPGLSAQDMLREPRAAYLLFGIEPELDCDNPMQALQALQSASFNVLCTPFVSEVMREYAHVVLPIAGFGETSGTFVNVEGRWQSFTGAIAPPGQVRPGWKVLRVLGNMLSLPGFDYLSSEAVRDECKSLFAAGLTLSNRMTIKAVAPLPARTQALWRVGGVPIYAVDALVRRAASLQQTPDARPAMVYINSAQARQLGLETAGQVRVTQDGAEAILPLVMDEGVPDGCVWIPAGQPATAGLGPTFGPVRLAALA